MRTNEWRCILISFVRSSWLKTRGRPTFLFPKSPRTETPWIHESWARSVSSPPAFSAVPLERGGLAPGEGNVRRWTGARETQCGLNKWKSGWGQRHVFSFSLSSTVRVSLSLHSSIKRGEKNGCNLFLTLFLNASLRHLHTADRTLISDVKKSRKRQTHWWFAVLAELNVWMIHVWNFTCSLLH